ncbi:MAG: hypothetical protein WCV00_01345 [Verrucomicrobiia bacterium]|jgi:hypothetical protein
MLALVVKLSMSMKDKSDGRAEIGITLHVGGLLVSGIITTPRDFLMNHPLTDQVLEVHDELMKAEATDSKDEDSALPEFVHLRNARFFVPGQLPIPQEGVYWRGRLSEIAGYSFGVFQVAGQTQSCAV